MNSIYGDERNNYSTFSNALLAVLVGHAEKVKSEASQIEVIQAGGTSVSIDTYKYSKYNEEEGDVNYLINFQYNKTEELKVNLTDAESGGSKDYTMTTLFRHNNNNILLRLPKKYKINKMTVVDKTGKKYEIVAQ
jgi:predicted metal-dependent phosphotriesterase family hydrolase